MIDTKEMYGKTGGIVAYHAYISFKPGEVTPEEAQQVRVRCGRKIMTSRKMSKEACTNHTIRID